MKVDGSKVRIALAGVIIGVLLGVYIGFSASPSTTQIIGGGIYPGAPSYTIWKEGSNYFAKNANGELEFSGTNATQVIQNAWNDMPNGGTLFLRGKIEFSTGLVFNLKKYVKGLILKGEGETATELLFTGTGYAITINTTDTNAGYYYFRIENMLINGSSITSGRNGILISRVGRSGVISHVKLYNFDYAIRFDDAEANEVYFYNMRIVTCNYGVYIHKAATNEMTFTNCEVADIKQVGYYVYGASGIRWYGGMVATENIGIYIYNAWESLISGVYFHADDAAYVYDLVINGTQTYPSNGTIVQGCYFNGMNKSDYGIYVNFAKNIKIDNCRSRYHNIAFIHLEDNPNNILIVNPQLTDGEKLLGGTLTKTSARLAGMVITPNAVGVIAYSADETLEEGDVVSWKTSGDGCVYKTNVANDNYTTVVMFANQGTASPTVVAISGIVKINNATNVNVGDILVSSSTLGKCTVDNTETNPLAIIGYVVGVDENNNVLVKIGE